MASDPADEATVPLVGDRPPEPSPLALVAAGMGAPPTPLPGTISVNSAVDALRDEEIARTRTFIAGGWAISVVAIAAVLFMDAPRVLIDVFVGGLVVGFLVSARLYRKL